MIRRFLHAWVDKGSDDLNRTFSLKVAARLLFAMILAGLPAALYTCSKNEAEHARQEQAKQDKLDQEVMNFRKRAEAGEGDEAFQRLFGVKGQGNRIKL